MKHESIIIKMNHVANLELNYLNKQKKNDLQLDPLSTISAIWPNVMHGHQKVKQPNEDGEDYN